MRTFSVVLFTVLMACDVFAGDDQESYCRFVTEQAEARKVYLQSPSAEMGFTQPNTGLPMQLVWGATDSLSNVRKGGLTMTLARKNCELYEVTADVKQRIFYALPSIEKDVLRHRLDLIEETSAELDALITDDMKLVEAQNLTRSGLYALQSAKVRLDISRTAALTGIATPYVPPLSDTPLKTLISAKLQAEGANESAAVKLQKQDNWDVNLTVGAHRQLNQITTASTIGAFGEVTATYNLSSRRINHHLDASAAAYSQWKERQFDDVSNQSEILKRQMTDTVQIQESHLKALMSQDHEIETDIRRLDGVETNAALSFRNQLIADQMILRVDIGDMTFRIALLQQYLTNNF